MLDCSHSFLGPLPDDPLQLCLRAELSNPGTSMTIAIGLLGVSLTLLLLAWVPHLRSMRREEEGLNETEEALTHNVYRLPEHAIGPFEALVPPDTVHEPEPAEAETQDEAIGEASDPQEAEANAEPGGIAGRRDPMFDDPHENDPANMESEIVQSDVDLSESHAADKAADILASIPEITADQYAESREVLFAESLRRRVDLMEDLLASDAISPHLITKKWIELLREANDLHVRGVITTEDFSEVNTQLLGYFSHPDDDSDESVRKVGTPIRATD